MAKDLYERFSETKSQLENSFEAGELNHRLFVDFINQVVQIRADAYDGKVYFTRNPSVMWVIRDFVDPDTYEKHTYADAYMTFDQLELFTRDPFGCVPQGTEPGGVFVFTINEDFIKEIIPYVLTLYQYGAPYVKCFMWDGENYEPYELIEIIQEIAEIIKEPSRYKKLKKAFTNKIQDIDDLKCLKNLKMVAEVVG